MSIKHAQKMLEGKKLKNKEYLEFFGCPKYGKTIEEHRIYMQWWRNKNKDDYNAKRLDWANKNPNDPRSAQIKNRLGAK